MKPAVVAPGYELQVGVGSWIWDRKTRNRQVCRFYRAFEIPSGRPVKQAHLGNLSFDQKAVELPADKKLGVTVPPGGGFELTLNP